MRPPAAAGAMEWARIPDDRVRLELVPSEPRTSDEANHQASRAAGAESYGDAVSATLELLLPFALVSAPGRVFA